MLTASVIWIAAIGMLWMGFRARGIVTRAGAWPTVHGTVLSRDVGDYGSGRSWKPLVRYRFEAGGKTYESDKYYPSDVRGGVYRQMKDLAMSTPDVVDVHYNPADPSECCLTIPGMLVMFWLWVGGALVFTIIGMATAVAG